MHLITDGWVKLDDFKGQGKLLLTGRSLFVFKANSEATSLGGALGGLVGVLIGRFIDKQKAQKAPPPHLTDLEIIELDERSRKELLTTSLLLKLPFGSITAVKPTRLGFEFTADAKVVTYDGWAHKKKIARFLGDSGIHVSGP